MLLPTVAFAAGLASVFCALGLSASFLGGVFGGGASANGSGGGEDLVGTVLLAVFSSGVAIAMGLQLLDLVKLPLPSFQVFSEQDMNMNMQGVGVGTDSNTDSSMSSEIEFDEEGNMIMVEKDKPEYDAASALFRTFLLGGSSALVASPCGKSSSSVVLCCVV